MSVDEQMEALRLLAGKATARLDVLMDEVEGGEEKRKGLADELKVINQVHESWATAERAWAKANPKGKPKGGGADEGDDAGGEAGEVDPAVREKAREGVSRTRRS